MERMMLVLVLMTLAMLNAGASAEDMATTLEDIYFEETQETIQEFSFKVFTHFKYVLDEVTNSDFTDSATLPLKMEILEYIETMILKILGEIFSNLGNIPVQSIYQDLNHHCADYLESPIVNLTVDLGNVTCVSIRLQHTLTSNLDMEAGLQRFSRECILRRVSICRKVHANCTTAYEERVANLLSGYITEEVSKEVQPHGATPLKVLEEFIIHTVRWVYVPYSSAYAFFTERNLPIPTNTSIPYQERLAWGYVKSELSSLDPICSFYRRIYSRESEDYSNYFYVCYFANLYQSNLDFFSCVNTERTSNPLTWSTVPSTYFHSQCLCLANNGFNCGVNPPQGVDPVLYCLSVLLRDFQRQVAYRPAVTYLDYAFKTPLPVCQFTNLIEGAFSKDCQDSETNFNFIFSVQCYFKGLVNETNNCSETQLVNSYNKTELCGLVTFMQTVICDSDGDVKGPLRYYMTGYSPLVLFLTYGDVVVRVLTVVTYLVCPQLRNHSGKLMIGYLLTTLLRLIVVQATLADMALAVRLDVATDLASTLWLTAYLHFFMVSIRDLRPSNYLSSKEARMLLLRSSLLGWVLPAALSVAFFSTDEAIDSHVQIGQLLFLLSNFVALLCNLYMFFRICSLYYAVKSVINTDVRKGTVFLKLVKFAIKTSVISGAAIILRLILLQIQDLEQLLSYCHALGTLQGLLVFVFYGCNREARAFWLQVFRTIHSLFCRRQNVPV